MATLSAERVRARYRPNFAFPTGPAFPISDTPPSLAATGRLGERRTAWDMYDVVRVDH